jgi:hypothetical protein
MLQSRDRRALSLTRTANRSSFAALILIALQFFAAMPQAAAQLVNGDTLVLESSALMQVSSAGQRTILSDFNAPAQGPSPGALGFMVESPGSVLLFGARVTRVALPGGNRTTVSTLTGNFTGVSAQALYFLDTFQSRILATNLSTGQLSILSNLQNVGQGPVVTNAQLIHVEPSGNILLIAGDGLSMSVPPTASARS